MCNFASGNCATCFFGSNLQMARKESDLVKNDNWNIDGLVNVAHVMSDWAQKRLRGILTAELTEAVRQEIGQSVLGLDMTESDSRKTVAEYLKSDANESTVETIRSRLRDEAQSQFDAGEYGAGRSGPVADPRRVSAIMPFIVECYAAKGVTLDPMTQWPSRQARIDVVAKFEKDYGGPRGKYHARIAELTKNLPASKTAELAADL